MNMLNYGKCKYHVTFDIIIHELQSYSDINQRHIPLTHRGRYKTGAILKATIWNTISERKLYFDSNVTEIYFLVSNQQ